MKDKWKTIRYGYTGHNWNEAEHAFTLAENKARRLRRKTKKPVVSNKKLKAYLKRSVL